jgi:hypothetical protein
VEYSESITAFQFGSDNAICKFVGSSTIDKFPYQMVPAVNTLGFLVPNCSHLRRAGSDTRAKVDVAGSCTAGTKVDGGGPYGVGTGVARGVEDKARPRPNAGTIEVVAVRGTNGLAEAGASMSGIVGVAVRGAAGVAKVESSMIGVAGAGSCASRTMSSLMGAGGTDPGAESTSGLVPSQSTISTYYAIVLNAYLYLVLHARRSHVVYVVDILSMYHVMLLMTL